MAKDEAPEETPCVRCGARAEGGFVIAPSGTAWSQLWWNRGRVPRPWRIKGTTLLDTHFMRVARVAGHRCTDCKLIFLES